MLHNEVERGTCYKIFKRIRVIFGDLHNYGVSGSRSYYFKYMIPMQRTLSGGSCVLYGICLFHGPSKICTSVTLHT